jgi:hypothetical protein
MNCPDCGIPITTEQQFCRSCGKSLVSVAAEPRGENELSRRQQMRLVGSISVFAGLAIALTGRMLFHAELIVYIGVLMNFLGMFLMVYPTIVPRRSKKARIAYNVQPAAFQNAQTTKKLTPMDDSFIVPSVTEGTTNLLKKTISTAGRHKRPLP